MAVTTTAPLAIGGNRLTWPDLPETIRTEIESAVGGRVIHATSKPGGFSPGLASVLELDTGAAVFAKAVAMSRNDFTAAAIRSETRVLRQLPAHVPAPRPRWSYDDGEWVVLVTDAVDGHNPAQPWRPDELARFLDAATVLARALTPSPFGNGTPRPADGTATPHPADGPATAHPADNPATPQSADGFGVPRLADDEEFQVDGWREAAAGDTLLHGDLRSDNFLLTKTGFVFVDWPSVCLGAPWLDLVICLPSIAMHGGGDPEAIWSAHPLSHGVDPDAVDVVLAGAAKFFLDRSREPVPPLLPTIRDFQRAQGEIARDWLNSRRR